MQKLDFKNAISSFESTCQKHGLKITPQRITIYKELLKADDHPSMDDIFQKIRVLLPNISFDTVYRTVSTFSEIGIVNIVEGFSGSKRFEPNIAPHHHLRCIKCNKIVDFYNESYNNIKIPEGIDKDFTVINKKVVLEGICSKCKGK